MDNDTNTIPVGTEVIAVRNGDEATKTIYYFGEGTYKGDEISPEIEADIADEESKLFRVTKKAIQDEDASGLGLAAAFAMADAACAAGKVSQEALPALKDALVDEDRKIRSRPINDRVREVLTESATNPRIDLYNGQTVWGYQCWWGPVEDMRKTFEAYTWELVEVAA